MKMAHAESIFFPPLVCQTQKLPFLLVFLPRWERPPLHRSLCFQLWLLDRCPTFTLLRVCGRQRESACAEIMTGSITFRAAHQGALRNINLEERLVCATTRNENGGNKAASKSTLISARVESLRAFKGDAVQRRRVFCSCCSVFFVCVKKRFCDLSTEPSRLYNRETVTVASKPLVAQAAANKPVD